MRSHTVLFRIVPCLNKILLLVSSCVWLAARSLASLRFFLFACRMRSKCTGFWSTRTFCPFSVVLRIKMRSGAYYHPWATVYIYRTHASIFMLNRQSYVNWYVPHFLLPNINVLLIFWKATYVSLSCMTGYFCLVFCHLIGLGFYSCPALVC